MTQKADRREGLMKTDNHQKLGEDKKQNAALEALDFSLVIF